MRYKCINLEFFYVLVYCCIVVLKIITMYTFKTSKLDNNLDHNPLGPKVSSCWRQWAHQDRWSIGQPVYTLGMMSNPTWGDVTWRDVTGKAEMSWVMKSWIVRCLDFATEDPHGINTRAMPPQNRSGRSSHDSTTLIVNLLALPRQVYRSLAPSAR